jgi:hypothetical protein
MQSQLCLRFLLHACAMLVVIGCGPEATSGPESAGVTVRTNVDRDPVSPGQTVSITITAEPLGSAQVRWITVATTGAVEQRDSATFNSSGPQQLTV